MNFFALILVKALGSDSFFNSIWNKVPYRLFFFDARSNKGCRNIKHRGFCVCNVRMLSEFRKLRVWAVDKRIIRNPSGFADNFSIS